MSMHVLFVAVGASRARAALSEIIRVTDSGGQAVLLIDSDLRWTAEVIPPDVRIIQQKDGAVGRVPSSAEWLLLHGLPKRVFRLVGGRGERAYFDRVYRARRLSSVFDRLPVLRSRRLWMDRSRRQAEALAMRYGLLHGEVFDLLVVCDAASMPVASAMMETPAVAATVAFSLASAVPAQRTAEPAVIQ